MLLTNIMRKQMQQAARALMSGATSAPLQKVLRDMPKPIPMPMPRGMAAPLAPLPGLLRKRELVRPHFGVAEAENRAAGQFLSKSFTNQAGTREYKLYIPSCYHGQPLPLVVMLHGCTQNPDDFANGTRMNLLADEKQCFVAYPAQAQSANASKCWNWFTALDQQRGQGEPSIIAGITCEVIKHYQIDGAKVYVAGLSAGGAMAVIMASTYPELYAALGVHSGLPYACAADLPSALAAMRGGVANAPARATDNGARPVPIIIFHGDSDKTVHQRNGEQLMAQNSRHLAETLIEQGQVPGGHRYTCTSQHGKQGQLLAEHWLIHGAGHAWSGGSNSGSYTDPRGPDATREMLRFFYAQAKPEQHS